MTTKRLEDMSILELQDERDRQADIAREANRQWDAAEKQLIERMFEFKEGDRVQDADGCEWEISQLHVLYTQDNTKVEGIGYTGKMVQDDGSLDARSMAITAAPITLVKKNKHKVKLG